MKIAAYQSSQSIAVQNLPGLSNFLGGIGPINFANTNGLSQQTGYGANRSNCWFFYLPFAITITKCSIDVGAVSGSANQHCSIGIYDANRNLLVNSGTFNVSSGQSIGVKTNTITAITIQPGFYWYVFTTSANDASFFYSTNSGYIIALRDANNIKQGTATATTGGTLNNPLGTVTSTSQVQTPALGLFES